MAMKMSSATLVAATLMSALVCYTISLKVSGERAEVTQLQRQIAGDLKQIRQLEAELRTRASLPQLQAWNDEVLSLVPGRADQYANSALRLASYAPQRAPAAPAMPQLAQATAQDIAPAATTPAVTAAPVEVAALTPPAPARIVPVKAQPGIVRVAAVTAARKPELVVRASTPASTAASAASSRSTGLLSDSLAAELEAAATAERKGFRKVALQ